MRIIFVRLHLRMKIILLLPLLLLTVLGYSQTSQPLPPGDAVTDTLSVGPETEGEEENLSESLTALSLSEQLKTHPDLVYICIPDTFYDVPAYLTYLFWDTLDIHPYVSDLTRMKDTLYIPLAGSDDYYHHPIYNKVNSDFGWRKWKYHYGIDLDLNVGDSIYCAFDGQVRIVKRSKSYGNVVVVRHNNGLETLYAHLSKPKVQVNQQVKGGELIGLGGNTGRSTGPHLHFEIRYLGGAINPNDIIDFSEGKLKSDTLTVCAALYSYLHDVRQVRYHVVRSGDTLGKIARKYGTSVSQLCKLNHMTPKTTLRIGRRIRYT